jgi:glucokinase
VTTRQSALIPVLEIGGSHVTSALVYLDEAFPSLAVQHRVHVNQHGTAQQLIDTFTKAAHLLDDENSRTTWGVAIPGPFDYDRGIAAFTGIGKFDALYQVDVGAALVGAIGPRMSAVRFINDATAYALGECARGAGRHHQRAVCLTLGTGVGSAFIAGGVPIEHGPDVPTNGWAYLLQWQGMPIEETVSRRAIRRAYQDVTSQMLDVHEIANLARRGDPKAAGVLDRAMTALGEAIGPWVASFNATVVVIGGSIAGSWDLLVDPLTKALRPCTGAAVVPAALGDDAPLIGAAGAAVGWLWAT